MRFKAPTVTISNRASGDLVVRDILRDPHPEPCPDCGRSYLRGENMRFSVVTATPGKSRLVWEGCVDCWMRRTRVIVKDLTETLDYAEPFTGAGDTP